MKRKNTNIAGYCIPKSQLVSENFDVKNSSIATLCSETSENVISGLNSLGNFIQSQGYDAMPSSTHPNPACTTTSTSTITGKSNRKNHFDFTQLLLTFLLLHFRATSFPLSNSAAPLSIVY